MIVSVGAPHMSATTTIALLFQILLIFSHLSLCIKLTPLNVVFVVFVHCVLILIIIMVCNKIMYFV